jgi:hypothetical protein
VLCQIYGGKESAARARSTVRNYPRRPRVMGPARSIRIRSVTRSIGVRPSEGHHVRLRPIRDRIASVLMRTGAARPVRAATGYLHSDAGPRVADNRVVLGR